MTLLPGRMIEDFQVRKAPRRRASGAPGIPFRLEGATAGAKLNVVRTKIDAGRKLPWLDIEKSRSLRNNVCHLKLSDSDLEIVELPE